MLMYMRTASVDDLFSTKCFVRKHSSLLVNLGHRAAFGLV